MAIRRHSKGTIHLAEGLLKLYSFVKTLTTKVEDFKWPKKYPGVFASFVFVLVQMLELHYRIGDVAWPGLRGGVFE